MKNLKIVLVILAIVFATSSTAVANLVVNGGFETNDLTGWTGTGIDTGVSLYVAAFNAQSGTYHVTTGYSPDWQYISQAITTTPEQSYTVGFWLSSGDNTGDNAFVARWNGATKIPLENIPYNAPDYTYYSYTEVATESLTTIEFGFRYNPGWYDFDNVSMNAVPIPGAIWLLGSGLIGLIGIRRKFKK